jgi:enamine deaminase RidA (YjgF/YER057c/UK114 family)
VTGRGGAPPAAAKVAVDVPGLPPPPFRYSHALRAGPFVFLSGLIASDYEDGIAPGTGVDPERPFHSWPVVPQTEWIYRRMQRILEAAGSSLEAIVRLDQFFTARHHAPGYFPVRDRFLPRDRPASTAVEMSGLLLPEAVILIDPFAVVPGAGFTRRAINTASAPTPLAGYSMAIRAGDWIWTAGASPTDFKGAAVYHGADGTGLAPEARVNPIFWHDYPIQKQLHYVMKKLITYLEAAGSDLARVVKAQVYLADMTDVWAFDDLWRQYFPENPPATLIAPITRMAMQGSRVEVSLIALAADGTTGRQTVMVPGGAGSLGHYPEAVRAGSLLFLSGQVAATRQGYHPAARVNPRQPYLASPAKLEMQVILDNVRRICAAAGGSLDSVVKAQVFFADLHDVLPAMEVWGAAFGDPPPTLTIVQTTTPHLLPRCRMTVDVFAVL